MYNLNLADLTDKEIQEKITAMGQRLVTAQHLGMAPHITDTLQSVIAACHEELYERNVMKEHELTKNINVVFDQEEYLKKKDEKNESTGKQNYRPGW